MYKIERPILFEKVKLPKGSTRVYKTRLDNVDIISSKYSG